MYELKIQAQTCLGVAGGLLGILSTLILSHCDEVY